MLTVADGSNVWQLTDATLALSVIEHWMLRLGDVYTTSLGGDGRAFVLA